MSKKEEIIVDGVALNVKHLQGLSQADFTEKMGTGSYKHLWADAENRDAIVAEAFGQLNPKQEATTTDGTTEVGNTGEGTPLESSGSSQQEGDAPKSRKRNQQ